MASEKPAAQRPGRILAYFDLEANNRSLLAQVDRLASGDDSEILALTVLRELPWYALVNRQRSEDVKAALERDARAMLETAVKPLVSSGHRVRTRVSWGRPFEVIIRESLRKPTRLVIKTARGEGRGESWLFGSTAMHLFRKCPVPVWVVKPRRSRHIRRVLAAVDPVDPGQGEVDLNRTILEWASRVATGEDAELHVCHAYWILHERVLRSRMDPETYRSYVNDITGTAFAAMADLVGGIGLAVEDPCVHLVQGDPDQVIPELVKAKKMDLLVIGTVGRAGVPGLLIGNTAERLLRSANCSVLALKPAGFVSPLQPREQA